MDWANETTLEFLDVYQNEPVLWDPTHPQRKDRRKMKDAWGRMSEQMIRPVAELKKKKDSLMATFRGHLRKKKASIRSGACDEDVFKPQWFAYERMEAFLAPVYGITTVKTDASVDDVGDLLTDDTLDSSEQLSTHQTALELQQAEDQMPQAFNILNNVVSNKRAADEPDECELFGQLIGKKLKRFSPDERELLMYDIQGLFVRRRNLNMNPESISNSGPSSGSNSSCVR